MTEEEYEDAMALLQCFGAIRACNGLSETAANIAGRVWVDPNPEQTALLVAAEQSGEIETARDIEHRYLRAHGVDIEARRRRRLQMAEESMKRLEEAAARFPVRSADEAGGADDAEP